MWREVVKPKFGNNCISILLKSRRNSSNIVFKVHDARKKEPVFQVENQNKFQVTSVSYTDITEHIVSGGIDNVLKVSQK